MQPGLGFCKHELCNECERPEVAANPCLTLEFHGYVSEVLYNREVGFSTRKLARGE
jgi:hypothetical protein